MNLRSNNFENDERNPEVITQKLSTNPYQTIQVKIIGFISYLGAEIDENLWKVENYSRLSATVTGKRAKQKRKWSIKNK